MQQSQEYVKMMNSGDYSISYVAKMAKVSRQTLYNWQTELANPALPTLI